ncbi:MAG: hypothetical protein IJN74_05590 [Clostridia bacterium]|nr:hypothetical protein [Clostridia bacterium]
MKKKLCVIFAFLIVLGGLLWWAYDFATDLLVKKTLIMVSNDAALKEDVDKAIAQALETQNTPEKTPDEPEGNSPEKPQEKPQTGSENMPSVSTQDGTLSIDDLQPSDKDYVMSIYKRFSASEVSQVSGMLSGGITPEEKQIIKGIVYAKVSKAEVNKLFAIAKKYQ